MCTHMHTHSSGNRLNSSLSLSLSLSLPHSLLLKPDHPTVNNYYYIISTQSKSAWSSLQHNGHALCSGLDSESENCTSLTYYSHVTYQIMCTQLCWPVYLYYNVHTLWWSACFVWSKQLLERVMDLTTPDSLSLFSTQWITIITLLFFAYVSWLWYNT